MHKLRLTKPDGRALLLYGRDPIPGNLTAPSPGGSGAARPTRTSDGIRCAASGSPTPAIARTARFCPRANTTRWRRQPILTAPTEVPAGRWDVAVFENLFPALTLAAHDPPQLGVPTAPAKGVCEVVVFTQDPTTSLGRLPLWHLELLIDVWADRYTEIGARPEVEYVYSFENRGVEVGVTLHHPHGQLYAYPFVPPVAARELAAAAGVLRPTRPRAARGFRGARSRRGHANALRRGASRRVHADLRALLLRSVGCAEAAGAILCRAHSRASGVISPAR